MAKSRTVSRKAAKPAAEPRLGIFWLVKGSLLIDSAPLTECEKYADHLTYPRGHNDVWEHWQRIGKVPMETEYADFSRGRVMYHTKDKKFTLLADRCILKRKDLIATIKKELCLPKQISTGTDPHYRCSACLSRGSEDE